jgi:hypothetical protein
MYFYGSGVGEYCMVEASMYIHSMVEAFYVKFMVVIDVYYMIEASVYTEW